ncbi:hypothetical protein GO003_025020 [Methylicorpusculum oleiharenae]|uniref:hypothetical protein n=1 Tax=Methylicorpusculum oleiharenae TaxID=1338687 RepID=UPI0013579DE5|nr:hypothetical protein [Methylicorpusculum oleiharenae]MCD2453644.1 hypothetical protein [Methylicorpusculum oleiharenae]
MTLNLQTSIVSKETGSFLVRKVPSIFTNRTGKLDIVIHKETDGSWGALYDGKRYFIAMIFEAETYRPIRSSHSVPKELLDNLVAWGF